jgi:peptidoglycan/xylan/chitin deacetylase (PgdA/CDA1 family)
MEGQQMSRERKEGSVHGEGRRASSGRSLLDEVTARLSKTRFVREALAEKADLKALRAKPSPRVWIGLGLVGFSYIIGWPVVGLLAWISYQLREPLIVAIGGPATYGLSHLVFLAGSYLAGVHYVQIVLRWAARRLVERLQGAAVPPPESAPPAPPLSGFATEVSSRSRNGMAAPGLQQPFSPALLTGIAAFLVSGLLLPIRPALAVIPLCLFVLLCAVAPFFPGFGFFLPVISRRKTDCQEVALTFDDGPDPDVTPRLLELLRRHAAPATFFVAGAKAERHPGLIREILSQGHTLGNHSYHHDPLLMLRSRARLREEVVRTQELLSTFAVRALTFRPPVGVTNSRLPGVLRELGLCCVTFSCRAFDRGNRRIAGLAEIILGKVRPGDIILLHDVTPKGRNGIGKWLAETEEIVSGLKGKGYRLVSLEELIDRPVMERWPAGDPPPRDSCH